MDGGQPVMGTAGVHRTVHTVRRHSFERAAAQKARAVPGQGDGHMLRAQGSLLSVLWLECTYDMAHCQKY